MKITAIVRDINAKLAGEMLSFYELAVHLDSAVDEINAKLNTKFPTFTEVVEEGIIEYTAIPDKYIRTVVIPCAAFKYFITDEEGSPVAPKYEEDFFKGLFYMERDFIALIPEEFLETFEQGSIEFENQEDRGLFFDGSLFYL